MDTAYRTSWIRRIRPIGYGVSDLLGMTYWATPVRRIGSLGMAYWLFGYGVLYILGTAYRASWCGVWPESNGMYDSSKSWITSIGIAGDGPIFAVGSPEHFRGSPYLWGLHQRLPFSELLQILFP
ncbi:hypothetical protein Tco_0903091 [Tanacetum coccineum]